MPPCACAMILRLYARAQNSKPRKSFVRIFGTKMGMPKHFPEAGTAGACTPPSFAHPRLISRCLHKQGGCRLCTRPSAGEIGSTVVTYTGWANGSMTSGVPWHKDTRIAIGEKSYDFVALCWRGECCRCLHGRNPRICSCRHSCSCGHSASLPCLRVAYPDIPTCRTWLSCCLCRRAP